VTSRARKKATVERIRISSISNSSPGVSPESFWDQ
jgi:hypothetical protein